MIMVNIDHNIPTFYFIAKSIQQVQYMYRKNNPLYQTINVTA